MTRMRLESVYRWSLAVAALGLSWSLWVSAQVPPNRETTPAGVAAAGNTPSTNAPGVTNAPGSTNAPGQTGYRPLNVTLLPTINREYLTFGLDRIPFLRNVKILGIPLWQYIASFLFMFMAFYAAKVFDFLTARGLTRWARRTATKADDLLLEVARGPLKIIVFVLLLHVGLSVLAWPPTVERWLSNALKIVVAVSLTYAVLKLIDVAVGAWRERRAPTADPEFDQQLTPIIRKALKALIIAVGALVTLDNVGVNINGLIASLSIGGLALGLAAQDTVANLFGAVSVLVDKPFKVGDSIQFDSFGGVVESIGLRSTRIRNADGYLITVPNKTMGNATVTNVSVRPNIRTEMSFELTYDTPWAKVQRAIEILREIYRNHPNTHDVWVHFRKFGASSLGIQVVHWWNNNDQRAYLRGLNELNLAIKRQFDEEGIEFAIPTRTLYVKPASAEEPIRPPARVEQ